MVGWQDRLAPEHIAALLWFNEHAGDIVPFITLHQTNPKLVAKAVGIRVPQDWPYALSIRETLKSPYLDSAVTNLPNGNWVYRYHRQDKGGHAAHNNDSLIRCMQDDIPVGVAIQQTPKPNVTYWIAGLGRVSEFDGNWFTVEEWRMNGRDGEATRELVSANNVLLPDVAFDPDVIEFTREVRLGAISVRQGQGRFRAQLLLAYGKRCAFTGTWAVPVLDAAHIHPYSGRASNNPTNGLLLRTDVHKLFDLGLMAVDSRSMTQLVSPELRGTEYETLSGRPLVLPKQQNLTPSTKALDQHREASGL